MTIPAIIFTTAEWLLAALIFAIAGLYAAVGHGGSSGYQAAMALLGTETALMKPIALTLNILVSGIASWRFLRAGYFSWRVFLPFALSSVPMAFVGGQITLPAQYFKPLLGAVLLFAAYRLMIPVKARHSEVPDAASTNNIADLPAEPQPPHWLSALAIGAALGLLSGLVGVGGGIFLSPLLLFMNWAELRQISGISAVFILVNSTAGLAAKPASLALLPPALALYALAAVAGGWLGAGYGKQRLTNINIRRVLAAAVLIAGAKMVQEGLLPWYLQSSTLLSTLFN